MVVDLAVLIYFIHHIATSIQLPQVIASIASDLAEAIDASGRGPAGAATEAGPSAVELMGRIEESGAVLLAPVSGYLQFVGTRRLVRLAAEADAVIRLHLPARALRRRGPPAGHRLAARGRRPVSGRRWSARTSPARTGR